LGLLLPALVGRGWGWVEQNRAQLGVVSRPAISMGGRAFGADVRYACGMSKTSSTVAAATAYAVLRVDRRKAKAMAAIAAASGHQMRTKPTPNADPNAPPPVVMFLVAGKTPYQAAQHLLTDATRRNRDTVLCREIVLSASPSYFRPGREHMGGVYEPDRLKAWASATLAWAKRTWPDQLASLVLHADDEQTPHAHVLVVPRVKGTDSAWRLNSKALFDRERLRELQTSYGEALAPLGIKRGEPGSKAEHSEVRQFYGAMQQAKTLPQRPVMPLAPRPPKRPEGIAASAAAIGAVLGLESAHQRELSAHRAAMNAWRSEVKRLRMEEAEAWERMRAVAAAAPVVKRGRMFARAEHQPNAPVLIQSRAASPRAP